MFVEEHRQFLHLLAYMYLQQSKHVQALALFRLLRLHVAKDVQIALSLAYCLHKTKRFEEALKVIETLNEFTLEQHQKSVYYFIKSKVLWDLGQFQKSRQMLHHYLKYRKLDV